MAVHTGPDAAAPVSWRRNQLAVTAASFMGFTGFTLVMPLLPLYIHQLGARDEAEIAMWAGLSLGVTPAVTAVLSPWWGRVADRFGRKLMVERSLVSFIVIMAATAFAQRPWHIFALRALQGLFAGYGGLTLAMAAESAPRERMASAIGLVQTSQRLGPALGPVIGGVLAGMVGIRHAFFVTAGFYAIAFVLVLLLYDDPPRHPAAAEQTDGGNAIARTILGKPGFLLMMTAIFGITFVDRSFGPILPLYVERLGFQAGSVALVSGILFSAAAIGAAAGNQACSAMLRRWSSRGVIAVSLLLAGLALGVFLLLGGTLGLALALVLFGAGIGVGMTTAYTVAGRQVPEGAHGTGFGLLTGSALAGLAISPAVCGLLSRGTLLTVFVLDLAMLVALAAMVAWKMPVERSRDQCGSVDAPMETRDL
ncbi:MAG: MFS transporter [Acidobacteria bacterium]|nr:MFS transporter [Acidobacteriota bacterium]